MNKKDLVSNKELDIVANGKKLNIPWGNVILTIAVLATVAGALFSTKILASIKKNIAAAKEAARPANVKVVKITTPDCKDCFNVDSAIANFKKQNVKVEEEKTLAFNSSGANSLIKQFNIKKLPTYIVTGEVKKNNLESFVKGNGEIKDNTFIFTNLIPLYIDTKTGEQMGKVTATLITDSGCSQCKDLKAVVENFKKSGLKIKETKELPWNSLEAQNLIGQYKITRIPTFIFSPEFDLYNNIKTTWQNFGTVEKDKAYVARNIPLPYRDLTTGQIAGLVDIVYLTDLACVECYSVQDVQKPILTDGYGVAFQSERFIDVSSVEGQNLISKYNISKVPTILLSPDADQYINLKNVWGTVGTIGADGWYVFTGFNQLSVIYKDLTSNQVIKPAQQQPNPSSAN